MKGTKAIKPPKPPNRPKVVKTTCRIPARMLDDVTAAMRRQEVSARRRSLWIDGAVERLLERPAPVELVVEEFVEPRTGVVIPLTLRRATRKAIDDMLALVPKDLRGRIDTSAVVRTAITQKLLGDGYARQTS